MAMMRKHAVVLAMMLLFAFALPRVTAKEIPDIHMQGISDTVMQECASGSISFEDVSYLARKSRDGTYVVTVSFRLDMDIRADDGATVSVFCAGQSQKIRLTGAGVYQFTFRGLSERPEVRLVAEVPLQSQDQCVYTGVVTALSMDDYRKVDDPYCTEVLVTPDRILDIHKYEGEGIPLPGIVFRIYRVAELSELEKIALSEKPTREDIRRYSVPEALVATLTTDPDGFATLNLTEAGYPDGIYLVVELPDITGEETAPFFLRIPGIAEDGVSNSYTVTVDSERRVGDPPEISEHILEPDGGDTSCDIFRSHTRILRVSIPTALSGSRKFTISETLPPQLTYVQGSPVVKVLTKSGEEKQLFWNTHFYVSEGSISGDGEPKDHFVIALTQRGMAYVMENLGEGALTPELRVHYEAYLDEDAVLGVYIRSFAKVEHVDHYGRATSAETESFGVCTGAVRLRMTDAEGEPLPGARFRIARAAAEADSAASGSKIEKIIVDGESIDVVFVPFVPGNDLSAPLVDSVATDENGEASFGGLAFGTCYIVESQAPAGHDRLTEPIEVQVNDLSHQADNAFLIAGPGADLPETGDNGRFLFTALGISIVCGASLMLLLNHRRGML